MIQFFAGFTLRTWLITAGVGLLLSALAFSVYSTRKDAVQDYQHKQNKVDNRRIDKAQEAVNENDAEIRRRGGPAAVDRSLQSYGWVE